MRIRGNIRTVTDVGDRSTLVITPIQPLNGGPIPADDITLVLHKATKDMEGFAAHDEINIDIVKQYIASGGV